MDSAITAAWIVGGCTIAASIANKRIGRTKKLPISKSRQQALQGIWTGRVAYDSNSAELQDHDATLDIKTKKNTLNASLSYTSCGSSTKILAKGILLLDSLIQIQYHNADPAINHFGTVLLNLSADTKKLQGRFVTYGRKTGTISTGSVEFHKE